MEKVIYRNKKNGKIGTLVQKNDKFRQYVLEVDGRNIPYSSATIKRWWEVVDNATVAKADTTVKEMNTEESTSISEPEPEVKKEKTVKPQSDKKPKAEKKSKKVSQTPKTSGPDMEVFSYIQEHALAAGYTQLTSHMGNRWLFLGKPRQNGKVKAVIHFYVAREFIRVRVKYDKVVNNTELMHDKAIEFSNIDFFLDADFKFDISLYKDYIDKFLALN